MARMASQSVGDFRTSTQTQFQVDARNAFCIIYKAYIRPKFQGISPEHMAWKMVLTYLHFRILEFSLPATSEVLLPYWVQMQPYFSDGWKDDISAWFRNWDGNFSPSHTAIHRVSTCFYLFIQLWMSSSQLTFICFRGVVQPPTRSGYLKNKMGNQRSWGLTNNGF